jgi:hypothetical protein
MDKLLETLAMYNINQPSSNLSTKSDPNDFDIGDAYKDNNQVDQIINPQQKGGGLRKRLFLNNRRIKKK